MPGHSVKKSLANTILLLPLVNADLIKARNGTPACKYIPGDAAWPTQDTWDQLNQTVSGRLVATVPQAAVCHVGGYATLQPNETACEALQQMWDYPQTHDPFPGEIMNPYYQNQSCDPYTSANRTCELGNYVSYSIAVSGADDVLAGVKFVKDNNVRLVIKNTGHDYLGKSTGKGGLALWTHNMKSSRIITNYNGSDSYRGPAVKLGAGMAGYDAEEAVGPAGYRIVAGDCPTVGITGGYTQGGGHSLLNSLYGMAADQVLEWEVVTVDGQHLTATPTENQDLYWALSGGGAGTFAVVLSMTVKIYPEGPVGGAALSFNSTSATSNGSYTAAIQAWWQGLPAIVDTGATVLWSIESSKFFLDSFTAPNKTADEVAIMLTPYLSQLDTLGIKYDFSSNESPTYYQHYNATNGPLPYGIYPATTLFNSRLIPRVISEDADRAKKLTVVMQTAVDEDTAAGWRFGCHALNVKDIDHPDNAVVPYWRDAIAICINLALWDWTVPWSEMMARKSYMAEVITPAMEDVTPESGAYLNEADPYVYPPGSLKWQNAFYGTNYPRLRQIKDKWDPQSVFYANTAVGSEDWTEDASGRLCKT